MTCREVDEALIPTAGDELPPQVREHLASCDSCRKLASAMASAGSPPAFSPGVRDRVHNSIPATIARVQPLAPAVFWIILFLLLFAGIGVGAAARFGIYGWPVLNTAARALIFFRPPGRFGLGRVRHSPPNAARIEDHADRRSAPADGGFDGNRVFSGL
jgi:hypothetical protein